MRPGTTPSVKFTYEDFVHFPNDGRRHELIDGEHYVTPSPNTKHQRISMKLALAFGRYLEHHSIGEIFSAPFDVVFSALDVVEPDLLYISRERWQILTDQHVRGAPDLAVEILSPGTRTTDEIKKRNLYERFGVREYWVVDPELDKIKVYRRVEDAFARVAELTVTHEDVLTTPLLPDFSVSLVDVFSSPSRFG